MVKSIALIASWAIATQALLCGQLPPSPVLPPDVSLLVKQVRRPELVAVSRAEAIVKAPLATEPFTAPNPDSEDLIIATVRMPGDRQYSTRSFLLRSGQSADVEMICVGFRRFGIWWHAEAGVATTTAALKSGAGKPWSGSFGLADGSATLELLFVVPKHVDSVVLAYEGKSTDTPVRVRR